MRQTQFTRPSPRRVAVTAIAMVLLVTSCTTGEPVDERTSVIDSTEPGSPAYLEGDNATSIDLTPTDPAADADPYADLAATVVSGDVPAPEPFEFFAQELYTAEAVSGRALYNSGPVLMTFSVPSCPICVEEAPDIAAVAANNPGITFVIVHSRGSQTEYEAFVEATGLDTPNNVVNLVDADLALWNRFRVIQQPTSVLVDHEGKLSITRGALAAEGLELVAARLEGRPPPTIGHGDT
ncbi:MAG: TlpA disulfide reductase family protein [Actinomycetota bacterium]